MLLPTLMRHTSLVCDIVPLRDDATSNARLAVLGSDGVALMSLALETLDALRGQEVRASRLVPLADARFLAHSDSVGNVYIGERGGTFAKVELGDDFAHRVVPMPSGFIAMTDEKLLVDASGERRTTALPLSVNGVARCGDVVVLAGFDGFVVVDGRGEVRSRHNLHVERVVESAHCAWLVGADETVLFDGRTETARLPASLRDGELTAFQEGVLQTHERDVVHWTADGEQWRWSCPGAVWRADVVGDRVVVSSLDLRGAWILDGGSLVAKVDLERDLDQACAFGDGIALRVRSTHDVLYWRPNAAIERLVHDIGADRLAAVGSVLVSAENDVLYAWRTDVDGPQLPALSTGGVPLDVPIVVGGGIVIVRAGGRLSLRGETAQGFRPVHPGAAYRSVTTPAEGLEVMKALVARSTQGPLPDVSFEGAINEVVARLSQLPLAATLPMHARALFGHALEPNVRANAAHHRDAWFGELAVALGVPARVLLAAARAGRYPLEPPRPIEGYDYLGMFTTTGSLSVSDPCYRAKKNSSAFSFNIDVDGAPGRWHMFASNGTGTNAARTAELVVVHEEGFEVQASHHLGSVAVDSGTAGVFDAACPKQKSDDPSFDEGIVDGLGALAHAGLGDGFYDVFAGTSPRGLIAKIRIHFLGSTPELDKTVIHVSRQARRYSAKERFALGDVVEHPKFGAGTVIRMSTDGKIDVAFPEGSRTLVHARG
jgi:hypothetical protein